MCRKFSVILWVPELVRTIEQCCCKPDMIQKLCTTESHPASLAGQDILFHWKFISVLNWNSVLANPVIKSMIRPCDWQYLLDLFLWRALDRMLCAFGSQLQRSLSLVLSCWLLWDLLEEEKGHGGFSDNAQRRCSQNTHGEGRWERQNREVCGLFQHSKDWDIVERTGE